MKSSPKLGVLRLDYDYLPAIGDIDHPKTFKYEVVYKVIPGLTFEICQKGEFKEDIIINIINSIKFLNEQNVVGITGDCGFMINIQNIVTFFTNKPVFLTSLIQLPSIINCYTRDEKIAIFTANSLTLEPLRYKLKKICNIHENDHRLIIVGCQDVDGFEAVANGEKVNVEQVTPGIVELGKEILLKNPSIKCFLLECTELPPYADSLRKELNIPIYDSITNCNSFMMGFMDDKNFGLNNWQEEYEETENNYKFGDNLSIEEKTQLIN